MKKIVLGLALGVILFFGGCAALDAAVGASPDKPGPLAQFVQGVENATKGTPVGGLAALLMGAFGVYQKVRANRKESALKQVSGGLEGVVVGIDRALEAGLKVSVEKVELYDNIRQAILEFNKEASVIEGMIASFKAKERA